MASEPFVELLNVVRNAVDRELEALWDGVLEEHAGRGAPVERPLEAARALCLRGGKRLRAALVAVGQRLGGGTALSEVLDACCAVELLQAYFLIHDDWMDGDRLRRGGPAVHAALEEHFSSPHLAASGAVLAGDFTLALATRVLARAHPPSGRWPQVLERFARMQLDAVIGQKLDVLGDGSDLEEVYRLKTASYTVLGPLELGLVWSSASVESTQARAALEAFSVPLGIAFQLRDDLIGAFADSSTTGKPRGGDLLAGKRTMLVNAALGRRGTEIEHLLSKVLGNADATPELVERTLAALDACGARADVEARITVLAAQATRALDDGPWRGEQRQLLDGLLRALLERQG
jgi:geranylgeranyl diphosphate synthase, type I